MLDSGFSAAMEMSDESFHRVMIKSGTLDSVMQSSWSTEHDSYERFEDDRKVMYTKVGQSEMRETTLEPCTHSNDDFASYSSSMQTAAYNLEGLRSNIKSSNFESKDMTSGDTFSAKIYSEENVHHEIEGTDEEPTYETETKIEVMPDGTVVTRKITKTTRKRTVAKSVLTKSEDGEVLVRPSADASEKVRKFLSFNTSDSSTKRPYADASPDSDSAKDKFFYITKDTLDELEQAYTDDLPTETPINRRITVVHTETSCVEGEANQSEASPPSNK